MTECRMLPSGKKSRVFYLKCFVFGSSRIDAFKESFESISFVIVRYPRGYHFSYAKVYFTNTEFASPFPGDLNLGHCAKVVIHQAERCFISDAKAKEIFFFTRRHASIGELKINRVSEINSSVMWRR